MTESIVIIAENFWDGLAEKISGHTEILIEQDKIIALEKTIDRSKQAKVIQFPPHHTIMPGFIDCHLHLTMQAGAFSPLQKSASYKTLLAVRALKILLQHGFTTVRDVGVYDNSYLTVDLKNAINEGIIQGPRLFVAPHIISATGGHGDLAILCAPEYKPYQTYLADGCDEIQKLIRREVYYGADWIKFAASGSLAVPGEDLELPTYTQAEMNTLVATASELNIPACVHAYGNEAIKRATLAGVRSIEHGAFALPETLALMAEKGTFMVPTMFTILRTARNINNDNFWQKKPDFVREQFKRYAEKICALANNLAQSQVEIAFGTDIDVFSSYTKETNALEFQEMVQSGITPLRALRAATSVAAKLLRQEDIGVLAVGKKADLIALPGNPLQDIRVTEKAGFVMKDGVIYK